MGNSPTTRTCVVTGAEHPQSAMLRFVRDPHGLVVADLYNKLPGKGAWVTFDRPCLETAFAKNPFSRALKSACKLPENGLLLLEKAVEDQFYATLSLMRRAGALAYGFENARKLLQLNETGVYLTASNAESDSRRQLTKLCQPHLVLDGLHPARLGQVCGQDECMHAAVAEKRAATLCINAYHRLLAVMGKPKLTTTLDTEDF